MDAERIQVTGLGLSRSFVFSEWGAFHLPLCDVPGAHAVLGPGSGIFFPLTQSPDFSFVSSGKQVQISIRGHLRRTREPLKDSK